ncbi:hypothetical protein J6590_005484 [Homalodisca vitripennis]|nr:hypothetical protein J6590_005484 [Homalodisca vitripennis]
MKDKHRTSKLQNLMDEIEQYLVHLLETIFQFGSGKKRFGDAALIYCTIVNSVVNKHDSNTWFYRQTTKVRYNRHSFIRDILCHGERRQGFTGQSLPSWNRETFVSSLTTKLDLSTSLCTLILCHGERRPGFTGQSLPSWNRETSVSSLIATPDLSTPLCTLVLCHGDRHLDFTPAPHSAIHS